jgi:hypothetical protein
MTNGNQKAKIRERMNATGESYVAAKREVIAAQTGKPQKDEHENVYVSYTYSRVGHLEVSAGTWVNALGSERQRMVEEAFAEQLDDDFSLFGAEGIAGCTDGGELDYSVTTQAESDAAWDAEAIDTAMHVYAGIEDHEAWPDGVRRPAPRDSYVTEHKDIVYVVLRVKRETLAVIDATDGNFTVVSPWPKEIETR